MQRVKRIKNTKYVFLETSNTDIRGDIKYLLNHIAELEKEVDRLNQSNQHLSQLNQSNQHAFELIYHNMTNPHINSMSYIKYLITQISRQQLEVKHGTR